MIKPFIISALAALTITATAQAQSIYLPYVSTGQPQAIATPAGTIPPQMSPAPAVVDGETIAITMNYFLGCLAIGDDMNDYLADVPAEHKEYIKQIGAKFVTHYQEGTRLDIHYNGRYWSAMTDHDYKHWLDTNLEYMDGNNVEWSSTPADVISNTLLLWHLVDYLTSHE